MALQIRLGNRHSLRLTTSARVWAAQVFRRGKNFEVVADTHGAALAPCDYRIAMGAPGVAQEVRAQFKMDTRRSPPMLLAVLELPKTGEKVRVDTLRPHKKRKKISGN